MKNKLLAVGIVLLFGTSLYAQSEKLAETSLSNNVTDYIIGIGNADSKMYFEVLNYIKNEDGLRVFTSCETQQILGVVVKNSTFKSYDVLRDLLLTQYPTLLLFRKDSSILANDCKNEILKQ